jgi:hypothetical protein
MLSITNPQVEEARKSIPSPPESRRAQERSANRGVAPAPDACVADEFVGRVYETLDRPRYGRPSKPGRRRTSFGFVAIVLATLLAAAWYGYPRFHKYVRQASAAAGIELSVGENRTGDTLAE